jgi:signal transduction histidine kinase/ligand-binding sensor domain-containing protein
VILRNILLACIVLAWSSCVFALDPALDINQYAHTAWKIRDGFTRGQISSIAQTTDGYLWLGTEFGLLRFDGVKNVPWQPPTDTQLPSNYIFSLLAARDGTLWIGTSKGLASWKEGKLTQYAELAGHYIFKILEDHEGTVWASGLTITTGRLCAIRNGGIQCYGDDGSLGRGVFNLYEDSKGTLWAGVKNGLWRWNPGPQKFYPLAGEPDGIQALSEDVDGALMVGWNGEIYRFVDGKTEVYPLATRSFRAKRMLRDRDGGLWIGTEHGLVHVHRGRTELFLPSDGLSGELVYTLLEDREGSIWVATINGLDRFRDYAVGSLTAKQGLSSDLVGSVLAAEDGSIFFGTNGGLNRLNNGQIAIYGGRDGKLKGDTPNSLFQDDRGRIWISTHQSFGRLENDRFVSMSAVPGGAVTSIAQDRARNLWLANEDAGLFQLLDTNVIRQIPWSKFGNQGFASALATDPSQNGLWIGFVLGGVAYFSDGQLRSLFTTGDGLGGGRVNHLQFDQYGVLWAATDGGLSRLKDGRVATLTSKNGLPCDTVHWVMEDDADSYWLYTACGLVQITRAELDAWAVAVDQAKAVKPTIQLRVFDNFDGVRRLASGSHFSPQVAKSADGRLWFLPWDGVSVVDPRHISFNKLPPPVHVEQITVDHRTYDASEQVQLPALVRDLQIDYTGLSLVAPEKVLFRYKLEGFDQGWQDAGTRRQAFYTNLPPRNYRFRVMACNNDGVWNESGAFLDFSIAPAYYQTTWFRLLVISFFVLMLLVVYQLRLQQVARQVRGRMEERLEERERIARELHDTLLQSFQGILLHLQAVSNLLPSSPQEGKQKLGSAIDRAALAIREGRLAVHNLRSSVTVTKDLAFALNTLGRELASAETNKNAPTFHVDVEGETRDLHPVLRDEVYRIAGEAMRNAFRHGDAHNIEVEIRYDKRQLRLRMRDDGKGIDPKVLNDDGSQGHYGLRGMRERAKLLGGELTVWTELDSGTEVELTIPAAHAYTTAPRSWLLEKFFRKDKEAKS